MRFTNNKVVGNKSKHISLVILVSFIATQALLWFGKYGLLDNMRINKILNSHRSMLFEQNIKNKHLKSLVIGLKSLDMSTLEKVAESEFSMHKCIKHNSQE